MAWTPERVNLCIQLWARGYAASIVGDALGDVTRNAVIGKMTRLGVSQNSTVTADHIQSLIGHPVDLYSASDLEQIVLDVIEKQKALNPDLVVKRGDNRAARQRSTQRPRPKSIGGNAQTACPPDSTPVLLFKPPKIACEPVVEKTEDMPDTACTLQQLGGHSCRWPIGDPKNEEFRFCGANAPFGPYCEKHQRIASPPPESRRRREKAAKIRAVPLRHTGFIS